MKDPVSEAKLVKKYGDLQFFDVDTRKMFYTDPDKLQWTRRSKKRGGGYCVIGYSEDYEDDDPQKEDHVELFAIVDGDEQRSAIHDLLQLYYSQHPEKRVHVLREEDSQRRGAEELDDEETDLDDGPN